MARPPAPLWGRAARRQKPLQNAPDARFPFQAKAGAFLAWGRGSRSAPDRGESIKVARPGSQGWVVFLLVIALGLLVMLGVIFVELSQRRIPVQYAKRMVGRRMFGGTTT